MKTQTPIVTVTTAQALSDKQRTAVQKLVEVKLGHHCQISEQVDPGVVGGVRIAIGDQLFDATISGKLERLQPLLQVVTVTTAQELTSHQRTKLTKGLESKLSEPFQLKEIVDPAVVGGVRITVGSQEYDGTIRKSLDTLRHSLIHN